MQRRLAFLLAAQALLVPLLPAQSIHDSLVARQVAAPPGDIESGLLRLPDPAAGAVRSRAALFELSWAAAGPGAWQSFVELPVARGPLSLAVQGHGAGGMSVAPAGRGPSRAPCSLRTGRSGAIRSSPKNSAVRRCSVGTPVPSRADPHGSPYAALGPRRRRARGSWCGTPLGLTAAAFVDSHELVVGQPFGLVAQVERNHSGVGAVPARPRGGHRVGGADGSLRHPSTAAGRRRPERGRRRRRRPLRGAPPRGAWRGLRRPGRPRGPRAAGSASFEPPGSPSRWTSRRSR